MIGIFGTVPTYGTACVPAIQNCVRTYWYLLGVNINIYIYLCIYIYSYIFISIYTYIYVDLWDRY